MLANPGLEASMPPRFPAYSDGLAGASFKPEHVGAIVADSAAGLLRSPCRKLHGRRRPTASRA